VFVKINDSQSIQCGLFNVKYRVAQKSFDPRGNMFKYRSVFTTYEIVGNIHDSYT